jgi:RNA 3'-terminal phosphate cyclase (ATP)
VITIDGAQGEGGGQIVRTSLALSLVTGQAFRIESIRAKRRKPGLLRQHLTAVEAATAVGNAAVDGAQLGSTQLTFKPGSVRAGDYTFAVGTAGSAEIAFDGVQRSTRYPGGVALRFARVLRYRDDKTPAETDTLGSVRALLSSG